MGTIEEGFVESEEIQHPFQVGEGTTILSKWIGKQRGYATNATDGATTRPMKIDMSETMCVPDLKVNLFSLTKCMDKGKDFYSHKGKINVKCSSTKRLCFDKRIKTKHGFVLATIIKPVETEGFEQA